MSREWQVSRHGERCVACGRQFADDETFQARLYESAAEGYERRDYCLACPAQEPTPAVGTWKTKRPPRSAPRPQPFDREAIFDFFVRLEGADSPEKVQLRFALALFLWRKKLLRFERTHDAQGGEEWHFSQTGTDATFVVARPALDEDEIERLSQQLEQLMAGELARPGETVSSVDPANA
ncbi:MAG: hypothetical protein CHACPFDD_00493 [Phycisphaerae bacterium]|nr:hypothetical protein [Phycisphaerae bacterium]